MLQRLEVALKPHLPDVVGKKTAKKIKEFLGIDIRDIKTVKIFTLQGLSKEQAEVLIRDGILHDPVLQTAALIPDAMVGDYDWILEVGFKPGVTDNEGRTAKETVQSVLSGNGSRAKDTAVYTSTQYRLKGSLQQEDVESIARDLLCNELIQRFELKSAAEWEKAPGFEPKAAEVFGQSVDEVHTVDIAAMSDEELIAFSRDNVLALSLEEMHRIQEYYADEQVRTVRKEKGLPPEPTDAELECLAQTWSEHCKHKIFNAAIDYENKETGKTTQIQSLFKSCIQEPTEVLRKRMGKDDFCLSVFKDNAGVIRFDEGLSVCIKVETHNSPSALDPYGGALTGIVGVNRDPMGTGLGADMLMNTDVFCFASPHYKGKLPPRLLHPRRVLEGVREGVEHGGNKSGIPTVNGSIVFHERYLGKPLVYCGTIGTIPARIRGRRGHEKKAQVGDAVIMVGGRIGKDGIHGATFSSEELHEGSPATAVQIGDPITQRKMYDFIIRARNLGLYNSITDNGAGGLSSSVGETAEDTNGAQMDLGKAPLKYDGLSPWEILISEAQERMTLAVPPEKLERFLSLAEEMDVEAAVLGEFTDSGYFHVTHNGKPVALLDMHFLHYGVPRMQLKAVWERPDIQDAGNNPIEIHTGDHGKFLRRMLSRLNICSKEYVIRQYDHEVKGISTVKPLVGAKNDGPGNAAVVRPVLDKEKGLVTAHGICPKYSDLDTYWMTANCVDEAVRNAVAVGADLRHMAGVDNFCWCDPIQSEKTPDGHYKLAQLVRANQALAHFCLAYGVPCISGKDSMKNDYYGGGIKISIPPTVLFSVIGVVPDVNKAVTSDLKRPGEIVYILGLTKKELGGSELADELGISFAAVPQVDALQARERYLLLFEAMQQGWVSTCHDLSDGGLGTALAEAAIGGRLGLEADLDTVPTAEMGTKDRFGPVEVLYSETPSRFLVGVLPEHQTAFESLFHGKSVAMIGKATKTKTLKLKSGGEVLLEEPIEDLTEAWQSGLI